MHESTCLEKQISQHRFVSAACLAKLAASRHYKPISGYPEACTKRHARSWRCPCWRTAKCMLQSRKERNQAEMGIRVGTQDQLVEPAMCAEVPIHTDRHLATLFWSAHARQTPASLPPACDAGMGPQKCFQNCQEHFREACSDIRMAPPHTAASVRVPMQIPGTDMTRHRE